MPQLIDIPTPTLTAAELAAQSVIDSINAEINHRVEIHRTCFDTIWNNQREGATPAAVLAAMGPRAALVFAFADANLQHINACAQLVGKTLNDFLAPSEYTPPQEVTINNDGTVTL